MHENEGDIANEERIATRVAEMWGFDRVKAPSGCPVDGVFIKGSDPYCFYEIKKRNYKLQNLPSIFIDKSKLDKCWQGAKYHKIKLVLIFEFDDGVYYCPIVSDPVFETKVAGPKKERDSYDRDEVYLIPRSDWVKIYP